MTVKNLIPELGHTGQQQHTCLEGRRLRHTQQQQMQKCKNIKISTCPHPRAVLNKYLKRNISFSIKLEKRMGRDNPYNKSFIKFQNICSFLWTNSHGIMTHNLYKIIISPSSSCKVSTTLKKRTFLSQGHGARKEWTLLLAISTLLLSTG